ncbi:hypothetical protein BH20ACT21_BH20ACT21_02080 [soil metagenome]
MAQRSQLEALRNDADVLAMRERRFFELADTIRKNMDGRLPDGKRRVVIETLDVKSRYSATTRASASECN